METTNTQSTVHLQVVPMVRGEAVSVEREPAGDREYNPKQNDRPVRFGETPDHKIVRDMEGMGVHDIMKKLSQKGFRDNADHSWNENTANSVINDQYAEADRGSDKDMKKQETNAQKQARMLAELTDRGWGDWHMNDEDMQMESLDERMKREALEKHYTVKAEETIGEGIPDRVKKDKVFQQMYGKLAMEAALKGEVVDSDKVIKMAMADYYKAQDMSQMLSGLGIPEDMSPEQRVLMFEFMQKYLARKKKRLEDDEDDEESMNFIDLALQFAALLIGEITIDDERARKDMVAAAKPKKSKNNAASEMMKAVA